MTSESNLEPDIVFPSDDAADSFGAADEEDMDNFGAFDDFGAYEEEANTYPVECAHLGLFSCHMYNPCLLSNDRAEDGANADGVVQNAEQMYVLMVRDRTVSALRQPQ